MSDAPDAYPLPSVTGHVRFNHVSFAYFGQHKVLSDITLEAKPGQVIALLGATVRQIVDHQPGSTLLRPDGGIYYD
ncbi:MAG: hypothetical protein U0175_22030 [Caldilineaceae bacterium]